MYKLLCLFRQRTLLVALFVCTVCGIGGAATALAQALPVKSLSAGMHMIHAEVASTDATRSRGLMYRKELAPNSGMLFVFEQANVQCFWMRNTLLPLSIAFIQNDGTITNIADMAPMTETSHCSTAPVRYTLEMEQGWFVRHGISAGMKINGIQ